MQQINGLVEGNIYTGNWLVFRRNYATGGRFQISHCPILYMQQEQHQEWHVSYNRQQASENTPKLPWTVHNLRVLRRVLIRMRWMRLVPLWMHQWICGYQTSGPCKLPLSFCKMVAILAEQISQNGDKVTYFHRYIRKCVCKLGFWQLMGSTAFKVLLDCGRCSGSIRFHKVSQLSTSEGDDSFADRCARLALERYFQLCGRHALSARGQARNKHADFSSVARHSKTV